MFELFKTYRASPGQSIVVDIRLNWPRAEQGDVNSFHFPQLVPQAVKVPLEIES